MQTRSDNTEKGTGLQKKRMTNSEVRFSLTSNKQTSKHSCVKHVFACVRAKHPNMWISLGTFRFNSCKFRWNYESNFSNFVFCFKFNFVEITLPHFTMELDFELYLKCQLYPLVLPQNHYPQYTGRKIPFFPQNFWALLEFDIEMPPKGAIKL